jgi:hypothetical protein
VEGEPPGADAADVSATREITMKYITVWTIRAENMKAAIKRFQEGDPKIPGVKMTRFHELGTGHGFSLIESDDPVAVAKLGTAWSDLVDQKTVAVIEDAQVATYLK